MGHFWNGLPEIPGKAALWVVILFTEGDFHWYTDLYVIERTIGKIHHHSATLFELDHPVDGGWVEGSSQIVSREGEHIGRFIRELVRLQGINRATIRIDADTTRRDLGGVTLFALSAYEAQYELAVSPEGA